MVDSFSGFIWKQSVPVPCMQHVLPYHRWCQVSGLSNRDLTWPNLLLNSVDFPSFRFQIFFIINSVFLPILSVWSLFSVCFSAGEECSFLFLNGTCSHSDQVLSFSGPLSGVLLISSVASQQISFLLSRWNCFCQLLSKLLWIVYRVLFGPAMMIVSTALYTGHMAPVKKLIDVMLWIIPAIGVDDCLCFRQHHSRKTNILRDHNVLRCTFFHDCKIHGIPAAFHASALTEPRNNFMAVVMEHDAFASVRLYNFLNHFFCRTAVGVY